MNQEVPESGDSASDLRQKLVKRLAMAGALVAILLGMLAVFDYLATPPEEPEAPVFSQPVPVAPRKEVSQPVVTTENLPVPPPDAPPAEPAAEAPPPPVVEAQVAAPVAEEARLTPRVERKALPVAGKPSAAKPAEPVSAPPVEAKTPPVAAVPEETAPAVVATTPSARVVETRTASPAQPNAASRLFAGFVLQAGVFTSAKRAEELHAQLTLSGVPSTLETRVQVGPFRTRQEAEAAQAKLKELGVQTILVPPKGKN